MGMCGNSIQLFNLGALHLCRHPGWFKCLHTRQDSDAETSGFQFASGAMQLEMVFSARRSGRDNIAFVQYPLVSDSPLEDAIRT